MNFRARLCYSVKKVYNLVKNLCTVFTNSFTIKLKSIKYFNFCTKLCTFLTFFTMVKTTKIHAIVVQLYVVVKIEYLVDIQSSVVVT